MYNKQLLTFSKYYVDKMEWREVGRTSSSLDVDQKLVKISVVYLEGWRSLGRQRSKSEDNIKNELTETELVGSG